MRRFPDALSIVACALLGGGWVCTSDADNRCPGALTCDIDVANVCCPLGSPVWCGACTEDESGCVEEPRTCSDLARVLECSFSATIETARCTGRASESSGVEVWTVEVSGRLTGCGEEVAYISVGDVLVNDECGSWGTGVFGGCIPPDDALSTTSWSFTRTFERAQGDPEPLPVRISRAHADVTLATATITCDQ